MLSRSAPLPLGSAWSYELKWDGFRALVSTEEGLLVRSRRGWDMTALLPELREIPQCLLLDGELVAWCDSAPYFPDVGLECGVCYNQGWLGIAEDLESRSRDPALIARRYAETFYRAGHPNRPAAHAGCLRGFSGRLRDFCRTRKTGEFKMKVRFQGRTHWCSPFS